MTSRKRKLPEEKRKEKQKSKQKRNNAKDQNVDEVFIHFGAFLNSNVYFLKSGKDFQDLALIEDGINTLFVFPKTLSVKQDQTWMQIIERLLISSGDGKTLLTCILQDLNPSKENASKNWIFVH